MKRCTCPQPRSRRAIGPVRLAVRPGKTIASRLRRDRQGHVTIQFYQGEEERALFNNDHLYLCGGIFEPELFDAHDDQNGTDVVFRCPFCNARYMVAVDGVMTPQNAPRRADGDFEWGEIVVP